MNIKMNMIQFIEKRETKTWNSGVKAEGKNFLSFADILSDSLSSIGKEKTEEDSLPSEKKESIPANLMNLLSLIFGPINSCNMVPKIDSSFFNINGEGKALGIDGKEDFSKNNFKGRALGIIKQADFENFKIMDSSSKESIAEKVMTLFKQLKSALDLSDVRQELGSLFISPESPIPSVSESENIPSQVLNPDVNKISFDEPHVPAPFKESVSDDLNNFDELSVKKKEDISGGDKINTNLIDFFGILKSIPSEEHSLKLSITDKVANRLSDIIENHIGKKSNSQIDNIQIVLRPEKLGKVEVSFIKRGSKLEITFRSDSHAAKDVIQASSVELKERLESKNILVDKFEFNVNSGNSFSGSSQSGGGFRDAYNFQNPNRIFNMKSPSRDDTETRYVIQRTDKNETMDFMV